MVTDSFTSFLNLSRQLRSAEEPAPAASAGVLVGPVAELVSLVGILAVRNSADLETLKTSIQLDDDKFNQLLESARQTGIIEVSETAGRMTAALTDEFKKAMDRVAEAQKVQPVGG
jgi:hypothetical protein